MHCHTHREPPSSLFILELLAGGEGECCFQLRFPTWSQIDISVGMENDNVNKIQCIWENNQLSSHLLSCQKQHYSLTKVFSLESHPINHKHGSFISFILLYNFESTIKMLTERQVMLQSSELGENLQFLSRGTHLCKKVHQSIFVRGKTNKQTN